MRYSRFSEDYKNIDINASVASVWQYSLYNKDFCVLHSPSQEDSAYIKGKKDKSFSSRNIFLTDDSGESWSILKKSSHINYQDFKCRYHLGYVVIETMYRNVISSVILFVPREGTVECAMLSIANRSGQKKKLRLFSVIDVSAEDNNLTNTNYDENLNVIYSYQSNSPFVKDQSVPYIYTELDVSGYDTDYRKVYGNLPDKTFPLTARLRRTSNSLVLGAKSALAVANEFFLSHEELMNCSVLFGTAINNEELPTKNLSIKNQISEISKTISIFSNYERMNIELKKLLSIVERSYGTMTIEHSEKEIAGYCNFWAKKNIKFILEWGQFFNQDESFRTEMLNALKGMMFFDKDSFLAKFDEIAFNMHESGSFDSNRYNDIKDTITLFEMFLDYLKLYKEYSLFDLKKEWSLRKPISKFLFEKIIMMNSFVGTHGLLSLQYGDHKIVEIEHTASSFRYYYLVRDFFELSAFKAKKKFLGRLTNIADQLKENLETKAFLGGQYIFGFHSDGYLLGDLNKDFGQFFLEPNLVSLIGDVSAVHQSEIYNKIDRNLATPLGYMSMSPAFKEYDESQFDWSYLAPGTGVNGGILVDENLAKMKTDIEMGNKQEAIRLLKRFMPTYSGKVCTTERAFEEPYAVPHDLISMQHPHKEGLFRSSMFSGNCGLLLSFVFKNILGIKMQYSGYKLDPLFVSGWGSCSYKFTINGNTFFYEVKTSQDVEEDQVMCDGRLCSDEDISFGITTGSKVKLIIKER